MLLARTRVKKSKHPGNRVFSPLHLDIFCFALLNILAVFLPVQQTEGQMGLEKVPVFWDLIFNVFLRIVKLLFSSALWRTQEISLWPKHLTMHRWIVQSQSGIAKVQWLIFQPRFHFAKIAHEKTRPLEEGGLQRKKGEPRSCAIYSSTVSQGLALRSAAFFYTMSKLINYKNFYFTMHNPLHIFYYYI